MDVLFAAMTTRDSKTVQYPLRVSAEVAARVDAIRASIESAAGLPVPQSAVLVMLVERGLAAVEAERGLAPPVAPPASKPKPAVKPRPKG